MNDKAAGQKTRSPEGCDENGSAAALLLSHVSIQICSFVAPCRRPILIATPLPQSLTWCTRGRQRRRRRNQTHRTVGNRDNGGPLFPLLAPVQLSLSRGRDALSGALAQRAGPGANPRGKTRFLASVVQGGERRPNIHAGKRPYNELTYQSMQEVLRAALAFHGFQGPVEVYTDSCAVASGAQKTAERKNPLH